MQSEKIPSAILNAAALLLQPYLPDLTPQKLETALVAKEKNAGELDLSRKLIRAECARILGVSVNSVHRYIQNGYLRAINISPRLVRIDPESVQELLTNGIIAREK